MRWKAKYLLQVFWEEHPESTVKKKHKVKHTEIFQSMAQNKA